MTARTSLTGFLQRSHRDSMLADHSRSFVFVAAAIAAHGLFAQSAVGWNWPAFSGAGMILWGLTWWAHRPLRQRQAPDAPVAMVLVPMAIRMSGVFAVLGALIWLVGIPRVESVVIVLFWYVTLTGLDLWAIISRRRRAESSRASDHSAARLVS